MKRPSPAYCPKCKGIVPVALAQANPDAAPKTAEPKPTPLPEPKQEEELEVNEAVDEQEEELEVNEAADEDEEVTEAADEEAEDEDDENSTLVELGFTKGKDPFKLGELPEPARKAVQKAFVKYEKVLWAGRPSKELIESKAWLGFVAGGICLAVALAICLITGGIAAFVDSSVARIVGSAYRPRLWLGLCRHGRSRRSSSARRWGATSPPVTSSASTVSVSLMVALNIIRTFTPPALAPKMKCVESDKFEGAGDLIFAYDFMGDQGVQVDQEQIEAMKSKGVGSSTPVGFMNINQVQLVRAMMHDLLIDPGLKEAKKKTKILKKKMRRKNFG